MNTRGRINTISTNGKFLPYNLNAGDSGTATGTYADMIALTPADGDQFIVTDYLPGLWVYSSFASEWKYLPSPQDLAFHQHWAIQSSQATYTWFRRIASGASSTMVPVVDTAGLTKYGTYADMATGTTNTGNVVIDGTGGLMYGSATKKASFFYRCRIPVLSTNIEEFNISLGSGTANISGVSALMFWYNRATNGDNWQAVATTNFAAAGNATTTITDTSVAVNTNYNEFVILTVPNSAKYYINGVLVATITTNIPTATSIFNGVGIRKTVGTTARTMQFDYLDGFVYAK